jgi:hypothetical protein
MRVFRRLSACGLFLGCLVVLAGIAVPRAAGWPSDNGANPLNKVHTSLTQYAIDKSGSTEDNTYATAILEGANTELHELVASARDKGIGSRYGVDVEAKRLAHGGTNEGCNDIQGWWNDALTAYRESWRSQGTQRDNARRRAYFFVGIMLHMIEDMGVPAHAHGIYHQGDLIQFDNFEYMSLNNWNPEMNLFRNGASQDDPVLAPWQYYQFSQKWTLEDAPNYQDRSSFSKTWEFASADERTLLRRRQGRTAKVAQWALESALSAFDHSR